MTATETNHPSNNPENHAVGRIFTHVLLPAGILSALGLVLHFSFIETAAGAVGIPGAIELVRLAAKGLRIHSEQQVAKQSTSRRFWSRPSRNS